jgi:hypothetical protein
MRSHAKWKHGRSNSAKVRRKEECLAGAEARLKA